jgi:hypothetical protein
MRYAAFLLGGMLVFAASAGAQANSDNSITSTSSASSVNLSAPAPEVSPMFALATASATGAPGGLGAAVPGSNASSAQDNTPPPSVYGVFQNYNWQATAGYTFFRFYVVPHPSIVENMNGINLGIVYYPHGKWIGGDGEFTGAFGSINGVSTKFALAAGGPRFRWSAPRGLEIWAHGLVGGAHFSPRTALGSQDAFAYEVGGGVDIGIHQRRFAYRIQADMVGTRFFNTYQYSPKVSVGIVFKY